MKVLLVNGSPNQKGCTNRALEEVAKTLENDGVNSEIYWIGKKAVGGCMACFQCEKVCKCIIDDCVNEFRQKAYEADGFVFGSPTHYAGMSGNMVGFMDRLFFSEFIGNKNKAFYMKPAAASSISKTSRNYNGLFADNKIFDSARDDSRNNKILEYGARNDCQRSRARWRRTL